jgi:hypothetical protein
MSAELGFYFTQLDAITSYFYLMIDPPQELNFPISQVTRQVSCFIEPRPMPSAERVRQESGSR